MDETDLKIIKILQQDGRINYNEIAKRLKLANATIHARIIKLQRNNIIDKFMAVINPQSVGKRISFLLSVSVNHEKDSVKETMRKLLEIKGVVNVYCVTGDWDYHILIHTKEVDTMKEIVTEEIKRKVPHIIRSSAQIILDKAEQPISV